MNLLELFGHSKPDTSESEDDIYHAVKTIGGRRIVYNADYDDYNDLWEIGFTELAPGKQHNYDMTGSGKEFEVMAFVLTCTKTFIKQYDPRMVIFTAKDGEESRLKLYRKMLNRFASQYSVTEHAGPKDDDNDRPAYTEFRLTRK